MLATTVDGSKLDELRVISDEEEEDIVLLEEAIRATQSAIEFSPEGECGLLHHLLGIRLILRYDLLRNQIDFDDGIIALRRSVESLPDTHSDKPRRLDNLGIILHRRFSLYHQRKDLEEAITFLRSAVEFGELKHYDMSLRLSHLNAALHDHLSIQPNIDVAEEYVSSRFREIDVLADDHPDKPSHLKELGKSLFALFRSNGEKLHIIDVDEVIASYTSAVGLTPNDHADKLPLIMTLAAAIHARFQRSGTLDDLNQSISLCRQALELESHVHHDAEAWSSVYNNAGAYLLDRFQCTRDRGNLEEAILLQHHAVELLPDMAQSKFSRCRNLGTFYFERFQCTGDIQDLETAISIHRDISKVPHVGGWRELDTLGFYLRLRFEQLNDHDDLRESIKLLRRAMMLLPPGSTDRPTGLRHLADSVLVCYQSLGEEEDLEEAISLHRSAVELAPEGYPSAQLLFSLGHSLLLRFKRTGKLDDVEESLSIFQGVVHLIPQGNPAHAAALTSLGEAFLARFESSSIGEPDDLERAISSHRSSVQATPDGHPEKALRLCKFGSSILTCFERNGKLDDLDQSIALTRSGIELTRDGHPDKPTRLVVLGGALFRRFERTGEVIDLDACIALFRLVLDSASEANPDKPLWTSNLATSLYRRFEHTSDRKDLVVSISAYEDAVELLPEDHVSKPSMLSHLCQALREHFAITREVNHLNAAILAGINAMDLSPDGPPSVYRNLGACLVHRFQFSKAKRDISEALRMLQKAIDLTPEGHPYMPSQYMDLGEAQTHLCHFDKSQPHFESALKSLMIATEKPIGSPATRLLAATRCTSLLVAYPAFSSTESIILAHSRIVDLLSEMVWLGHSINRRFSESAKLGELVNAAVSAAIGVDDLPQAVEWLEAGRALIWSQTLSLRTPLCDLEEEYFDLAASLETVRQEVQVSAHVSFDGVHETFNGIPGVSMNTAAENHSRSVIELEGLLRKIRADCKDFEDFLLPKKFKALLPSPQLLRGPVIFINVHSSRCDALILSTNGAVTPVALPNLTFEQAGNMRSLWIEGLRIVGERGVSPMKTHPECDGAQQQRISEEVESLVGLRHSRRKDEDDEDAFHRLLRVLWTSVVSPILKALGMTEQTQKSDIMYVTWCPTGPLTQLPLHAAGDYGDPAGPRAYKFVVSSYTPSLSALLRSCQGMAKEQLTPSALVVSQPQTPGHDPLPGAREEGRRLQIVMNEAEIANQVFDHDKANVESIRNVMSQYRWVHFACHGAQRRGDPTQSAFALYDGPLSLLDLMRTRADDAEIAFLSACQTATGDASNPEESAHLAAGMLAVGFKGVVATMWSIQDADAPVVVEAFYKELLALRNSGRVDRGQTGAAFALHEATKVLREKVGEDNFTRWVPFVHFGV